MSKGISISNENQYFFAQQRMQWLGICLRRLSFEPERVTDFGCGTGVNIPLVCNWPVVRMVHGIDISKKSLELARSQYKTISVKFYTPEEITKNDCMDLVYSMMFFIISLSQGVLNLCKQSYGSCVRAEYYRFGKIMHGNQELVSL